MKYKQLFLVYAVVLLIIGLSLLLLPGPFIEIYGATLQPPGLSMARFYGVSMLGVAWMVMKARRSGPSQAVEGLIQGNVLIWILSAGVAILGQIQETFNLVGLSVVGLSVFFLAWYGYIRYQSN